MFRPISQYEITHMENLMVRDSYWKDDRTEIADYCEIYKCKECPKYGDDCDGLEDEEDDDELV